MPSEDPATTNHLLNSLKTIAEVLRILYSRHIATHLTQALGKG